MTVPDHAHDPVPAGRDLLTAGNRLKLGLFGTNCSNGLSLTKAPTGYEATWTHSLDIARKADRIGLEMVIPIARWRGLAGETDPFKISYETMTWAAGIAASTERITVLSTLHLPMTHPVMAAKQIATIDHIARGRYGFNAVMGFSNMDMFGKELMPHDERYRYGLEWTQLVKRIWAETEPFDFHGEYFHLTAVESEPKPWQKPRPLILNAGGSPAGVDFAASQADINFAIAQDLESGRAHVERARKLARDSYQREIALFSNAFVICRETEAEAWRVHREMVELGDRQASANWFAEFGLGSESLSEEARGLIDAGIVGLGAPQFVGTPEQVADQMAAMHGIGIDGIVFGMLDYLDELDLFAEQVLPRLAERGLRTPEAVA